jgi:NADH-quinone oxidoreductase subunit L
VVQTDIKRVIAASTCSQVGYMFFAAGSGAYGAAMFHLFTHAFFKALLFLGAGSVIHAMHHEQDMRHYGALRKEIPFTFWAMIFGTLAITGVGVFGIGFAGYFSKDAILESAFATGTVAGTISFWIGALAALLTSFYSWRLIFLTFFGKARWAGSEHIQHAVHHQHEDESEEAADHDSAHDHGARQVEGTAGYHPHESPWTILVPLALLSLGAIFAGFAFHHAFIDAEGGAHFWNGSLAFDAHLAHASHEVPVWVKYAPLAVMLIGLALAYRNYMARPGAPAAFVAMFPQLHDFLMHKWYFDELYNAIFVRPAFAIGRFFWKRGDEQIIDRFGPHGAAVAVGLGNRLTTRLQSGYVYSYALVMLLGLIAATSWVIWWAS